MGRGYDEVVEFLASGPNSAAIVQWRASAETNARVVELLDRERIRTLSDADQAELAQHLEVEHLMRLIKARARERCPVG